MNIHWKDWCWSWNANTLATWCEELTHLKRPWCWERLKAGGEGNNRGWNGWVASLTLWTWVWASSRVGDGQGSLACSAAVRGVEKSWAWLSALNWTEGAVGLSSVDTPSYTRFSLPKTPFHIHILISVIFWQFSKPQIQKLIPIIECLAAFLEVFFFSFLFTGLILSYFCIAYCLCKLWWKSWLVKSFYSVICIWIYSHIYKYISHFIALFRFKW